MIKKKLYYPLLAIIVVAIILLVVLPFRGEPVEEEAFTPYISAFTSGVISNQSTIRVMLVEEVSEASVNDPVQEKLFDFRPGIKGEAYWSDSRTIEFRPTEKLPAGKKYRAEFSLDEVADVSRNLKTFNFTFQTINQSYETRFNGMQAYDPQNLKYQQLLGELHTADYAGRDEVEKMLVAFQDGEKRKITWQHDADGKTHLFRVDSVVRKEQPAAVK